ncbi:membrane protein [Mycobacteroides abscessus]|uniref:membrane protein n=1 Tax=Mycobacteroides abscessus TaxID=36809 RepID=UPI00046856CF|nr:membrane protein [Mycobacteroides abscessus]
MTAFLLSIHLVAAILTIGPVAVATSMFPRAVRTATHDAGNKQAVASVRLLHRITRVYAVVALAVPVFGLATAASLGVLGQAWLLVSVAITAVAAGILIMLILPAQRLAMATVDRAPSISSAGSSPAGRLVGLLGAQTGIFNLLWVVVVILMVLRPGSTTGVGL